MNGVRIPGQRRHTNRLDQGTRDINTELVEKLKAMA
jgi:delta1-piperideine-2-carboxylate reductase